MKPCKVPSATFVQSLTPSVRARRARRIVGVALSASAILSTAILGMGSAGATVPGDITTTRRVHDWFSPYRDKFTSGDMNGDGIEDLVTASNGSDGDVWVAFMDRAGNATSTRKVHEFFSPGAEKFAVGDINGDGVDDLISATGGTAGDVWVATMNRSGAVITTKKVHEWFAPNGEVLKVGDMNGDGVDDLVTATGGAAADVWVAFMDRNGNVTTTKKVEEFFAPNTEKLGVGDVNGDGVDDLLTATGGTAGDVYAALMTRTGTATASKKVHDWFAPNADVFTVGDMNGDGVDDLVTATGGAAADVWVAFMDRNTVATSTRKIHETFAGGTEKFAIGDINGDGARDILTAVGDAGGDVYAGFTQPSGSFGGPYGAAIVNLARAEKNRPVTETQTDWSPRINEYQATTGAYRVAWCASFVTWLGMNAGDRTPFRSAGVAAWYSAAANRQSGLSIVSRNDARPGDLVAFEWNGGTNFAAHGHIGVLTSTVASNGSFQTIEGNTTISGSIQGVAQKNRNMMSGSIPVVRAFIRINS